MIITKQPPRIHTAFNPAILQFPKQGIDPSDEVEITISYYDADNIYQNIILNREFFNDYVTFDVSPTVKRLFFDKQTVITSDIFTDSLLSLYYYISLEIGRVAILIPLTAINSVVQIGETSDLTPKMGSFLSSFDKLKKYQGYPLDVACFSFEEISLEPVSFVGFNSNADSIEVDKAHFCINIQDNINSIHLSNQFGWSELLTNASIIITNNAGEPIQVKYYESGYTENIKYIEHLCTPLNPFYLRWINQLGSRDYWMFSFRQEISKDVDDIVTYTPYLENQQTASGTTKVASLTGSETVTVGANLLSDIEYEALSKIIYSPRIEWYNEKLGKWIELIVNDSNLRKDTSSSSHSVELEFLLPNPQIQF